MPSHWNNPVVYMSRATAREVWAMTYGTEPDLTKDLYFGASKIEILFDDRMGLGEARIEESPDYCTASFCGNKGGLVRNCSPDHAAQEGPPGVQPVERQ